MLMREGAHAPVMPYPRQVRARSETVQIRALALHAGGKQHGPAVASLSSGLARLGVLPDPDGYPLEFARCAELEANLGREGYELRLGLAGGTLAAASGAGLYYAVQTLLQLLEPLPDGSFRLPAVEIVDWPFKPIRGVHTYLPAREQLPFFKRFIEWMGRHKLNTMFLEIGGGMEYRRHPEVNEAWESFCRDAMAYPGGPDALQASQWFPKDSTHTELAGGSYLSQEQISQIAMWCRQNCVEIMPEVQSLSHAYYLVLGHRDLAEIPEDPWPDNYCPSNPASYELYFDVLDEVVQLLQPGVISIGHDEAYIFNVCERCKERDAAEIYATDVTKSRDFLAERGVRTAMWGDKLLDIRHADGRTYGGVERHFDKFGRQFHLPPTSRCVDLIPRDVLILDWYWSLCYESAAMLAEKGFEMIYGNFHAPKFEDWATHRQNPALLGGETSLWCAAEAYSIGRNGGFHRLLWCANNLWSDFDPDSDRERLKGDIAAVMRHDREQLTERPSVVVSAAQRTCVPIDLTRAAGHGLAAAGADLRALPRGRQTFGGVEFVVPGEAEAAARIVGVTWRPRACPPIAVAQNAEALAFLHTTTVQRLHAPTYYSLQLGRNLIGHYLVVYDDGETLEIPLEYGVNIDSWNVHFMVGESGDQAATIGAYVYEADPVFTGTTDAGEPCAVFMHEWVNPRPDVPISHVHLLWDGGYTDGTILLVALSVVQTGGTR